MKPTCIFILNITFIKSTLLAYQADIYDGFDILWFFNENISLNSPYLFLKLTSISMIFRVMIRSYYDSSHQFNVK